MIGDTMGTGKPRARRKVTRRRLFETLDHDALVGLMSQVYLKRSAFEALIDPDTSEQEAAKQARYIAIATFDQGCCGPSTPPAIRALVDALGHPKCRAPAQIMRVLGDYGYENAEQIGAGSESDDVFDGFDTRNKRWSLFDDDRWPFLREIHDALAEGVPLYLTRLSDRDPDAREAASYVLSLHYPGQSILPALATRLATESDQQALAGAILCYSLQSHYQGADIDALEEHLDDDRPVVSVAAAIALANHSAKDRSEALRPILLTGQEWGLGQPWVTLGGRNLRVAASRALARLPAGDDAGSDAELKRGHYSELDDNTIVKKDTFLHHTVARVAAKALLDKIRVPKDISTVKGKSRERLEALARRPAAFSRDVSARLGYSALGLARALGLRPASFLSQSFGNGTVETAIAEAIVGTSSLPDVAAELSDVYRDDDVLDLVEDMVSQLFARANLSIEGPDERPDEVGVALQKEAERRTCRTVLLALEMIAGSGPSALPALRLRANAATGDRLGRGLHLSVFVLAAANLGGADEAFPEDISQVFRTVAHFPELVLAIRRYLESLDIASRFPALAGFKDPASCFYIDLLDRDGLLEMARYYNVYVEDGTVVPLMARLQSDDPDLADELLAALVERQADGEWFSGLAGAESRSFEKSDGSLVNLYCVPTPAALSQAKPFWPMQP